MRGTYKFEGNTLADYIHKLITEKSYNIKEFRFSCSFYIKTAVQDVFSFQKSYRKFHTSQKYLVYIKGLLGNYLCGTVSQNKK